MTVLLLGATLSGCRTEPPPAAAEGWTPEELSLLASLRLDVTPRPDPTNRWADDPAAVRLGAALFFDAGLSPAGVACSTCHAPELHFTDGRKLSEGVGTTHRHAPSVVGSQWGVWFFWDGRADSLWAQAAGPLTDPAEMASDPLTVARRATSAHTERWTAAFGPPPDLQGSPADAVVHDTFVRATKAIAAYERTLVPNEAPFDRYVDAVLAGDPSGAGELAPAAVRGLELFVRDAGCVSCHAGPMLTDRAFHNLGLPETDVAYDPGRTIGAMKVAADPLNCAGAHSDASDCPELRYLDPTFDDFRSAFKTPSLRDVTRTAPYMHSGLFATLDEVLAFYDTLPGTPRYGHRELTLAPLHLQPGDADALKAFLGALEGGPLPEAVVHPP